MRGWSSIFAGVLLVVGTSAVRAEDAPKADAEGFYSLFDGKSLDGWKSNENPKMAVVEDGVLKIKKTGRSHLFYEGPVNKHDFQDFEFKAKVKIIGNSNSGIYFHTEFQDQDWPAKGFEAQVCSANYGDPRKTGSLYGVKDVNKAPVPDDEWFDYHIIVKGKDVTIKINDKTVTEWTQEEGKQPSAQFPKRVLDRGTFALQGHDPDSEVHYKDIRVKPLK
ncbi:MAG: DUF1080 domain-containing protein [Pirellulales bacterium]|nr:DUF1080 domain-containing protein [Pirellulales bacterium]